MNQNPNRFRPIQTHLIHSNQIRNPSSRIPPRQNRIPTRCCPIPILNPTLSPTLTPSYRTRCCLIRTHPIPNHLIPNRRNLIPTRCCPILNPTPSYRTQSCLILNSPNRSSRSRNSRSRPILFLFLFLSLFRLLPSCPIPCYWTRCWPALYWS